MLLRSKKHCFLSRLEFQSLVCVFKMNKISHFKGEKIKQNSTIRKLDWRISLIFILHNYPSFVKINTTMFFIIISSSNLRMKNSNFNVDMWWTDLNFQAIWMITIEGKEWSASLWYMRRKELKVDRDVLNVNKCYKFMIWNSLKLISLKGNILSVRDRKSVV